jgi:hypothetical protein
MTDHRFPGAQQATVPTPMQAPPPRRRWWIWAVAAVVVLGLVGGAIVYWKRSGPHAGQVPSRGEPAVDARGSSLPITVKGDQVLRGGQPWWFAGYNSFVWSGNCGNSGEKMSKADVDKWFASMRHDGHGAVRLFFWPGWDINRLDAAVAAAKENGVYLMITLEDAQSDCGRPGVDSAWFDDQDNRDTYQAHMTELLDRYKGEHAIAWFEYFNEPSVSDGKLREFYDQMGAVADGIDPDRLFSSGTIAPYAFSSEGSSDQEGAEQFQHVQESPGVDIVSMHEYDDNQIESSHGPPTRSGGAGKPVIVGEFGVKANTDGNGCDASFATRAQLINAKLSAYTGKGYAGALLWAWQPSVGADECDTSNIDVDPDGQHLLRTFVP